MCLFARKVYDPDTILKTLNSIGYDLNKADLSDIAERIYATKVQVKRAMGFEQTAVSFPKRFFETPGMRVVMDEASAYAAQYKFNELTNELLSKYKTEAAD